MIHKNQGDRKEKDHRQDVGEFDHHHKLKLIGLGRLVRVQMTPAVVFGAFAFLC